MSFVHTQDVDFEIKDVINQEGENLHLFTLFFPKMFEVEFWKPKLFWWIMPMIIGYGVIVPHVFICQNMHILG